MGTDDVKQIELLSTFHYVLAGLTALFSCMPIFHIVIGVAMVTGKLFEEGKGDGPPAMFGWIFVAMGAVAMLLGWSLSICIFLAGKRLRRCTNRTFCMVVAGMECIFMPFGTALGVFSLITLSKDSVKEIFDQMETGDPGVPPPIP
ncbi:hypothetical protein ACFL01_04530 [Planctomycetota bacterium]